MNLKIKRIIFGILIIINCVAIFNFSAQDSDKSSKTSGVIVEKVVDKVEKVNKKTKRETLKEKVTFFVRKSAHFSIYTLLGIWLICFVGTYNCSTKSKILICVMLGFAYAISDEVHQQYISGRSCELRDVCIDTCGVLFGNLIAIGTKKITTKIAKKINKKSK